MCAVGKGRRRRGRGGERSFRRGGYELDRDGGGGGGGGEGVGLGSVGRGVEVKRDWREPNCYLSPTLGSRVDSLGRGPRILTSLGLRIRDPTASICVCDQLVLKSKMILYWRDQQHSQTNEA
ncbi:hypothetical protein BHM03_00026417 [Ensete ventricosum]|nr:hypothetical protein BHM03_00026417 [Ensete ventricosum]